MELNQLRYFLAVAENEHITRTAEALHIAQPALTKAIHRLEEEMGVALLAPKGRNIVLTPLGRHFQERLKPLLEQLDRLPEELQEMAQKEKNTIHLNVQAASTLITEAIIAYKKKHTALHFQMRQDANDPMYDIRVRTELFHERQTAERHVYVFTENIYLAVPNTHSLARRDSIALSEASGEGYVSLMGSRQLRAVCDRLCRAAGFMPNILFESDNPTAVRNMIEANMGVGFWPEITWGKLEASGVCLVPITEPQCSRDIIFEKNRYKAENAVVEDFFCFLKRYLENARRSVARSGRFEKSGVPADSALPEKKLPGNT